jgi:hypothetical protein
MATQVAPSGMLLCTEPAAPFVGTGDHGPRHAFFGAILDCGEDPAWTGAQANGIGTEVYTKGCRVSIVRVTDAISRKGSDEGAADPRSDEEPR